MKEIKGLEFVYLTQPPKRYTFQMPQVKLLVERWCSGKVLNLFCGYTRLNVDEYRVDSDVDMPADWHGDAFDFVKNLDGRLFDTVVLDPPYNLRKAREKYGSRCIGSLTKIKDELPRIIRLGGRVISLGYSSVGMSYRRGFVKRKIGLVYHGGDHNDTIIVLEEYVRPSLFDLGNKKILCRYGDKDETGEAGEAG